MNNSNVTDFIADFMTTTTVNIMTTMRFDNSSNVNNGTSDASDGDPSSDDMSMSLEAKLIKAHGIIMIFAWLVFASFGMLMPRYFKPAWPGKTWCGKAIWFQLHQPCMIITLLLTAAGFIIIFCSSKEYCNDLDHPGHEHPPLGIIVMILVILNPIMAAFRPEPNAEHRIIFNVLHFIVGLLAHLTSIVVIFLATYIDDAVSEDYKWCRWGLVAYIIWHALVEVTLAIHMHCCVKRTTHEKQGFPMDAVQGHGDHADHQDMKETTTGGGSIFKTFVIVMHSIVAIGCTVAIAVAIGLSVPPAAAD